MGHLLSQGFKSACLLLYVAACFSAFRPCIGQNTFFLADSYSGDLTSGQLTTAVFDFKGESLGTKQKCLAVTGKEANPRLTLAPCSSSTDTNSLTDKWAYNYNSNAWQSWGAAGSSTGPSMCLDAESLNFNLGSAYTAAYLRAMPCNASLPMQKWLWNGTVIKLGFDRASEPNRPDYWIAYKGDSEPFFALSPDKSRAQSFTFVIAKEDASGTETYTPCPTQDYGDYDIVPIPPIPNLDTTLCGDNPYMINLTSPKRCTEYCEEKGSSCVGVSYQGFHGCCYLKSSFAGGPANWFSIGTKKAVYIKGSVYNQLLNSGKPQSSGKLESSSNHTVAIALGTVGGSLAILALVLALLWWKRKSLKRHAKLNKHSSTGRWGSTGTPESLPPPPPSHRIDILQEWYSFEYKELSTATNGFSPENILGKGASSTVYKATLESGAVVAVKVIGESAGDSYLSTDSFEREIRTMGRIRHKNLVSLRGCAREGMTRLIVLDYAANGSVGDALAGKGPFLDWPTRIRVAEDAARGLNYLHNDIVPACLHRDIKPANILLDDELNAQVADFGLAKHVAGEATHVETRLAGTFGFMAPECLMTGNATKAGDVFAFGGFLLVLITGRSMLQKLPDGTSKNLVQWIMDRTLLDDPSEYTDASLGQNYSPKEAKFLTRLALGCVARADVRPDMATVLRLLTELRGGKVPPNMAADLPPLAMPDMEHAWLSSPGGSASYLMSSSNPSGSSSFGFSTEQSNTFSPMTAFSTGR